MIRRQSAGEFRAIRAIRRDRLPAHTRVGHRKCRHSAGLRTLSAARGAERGAYARRAPVVTPPPLPQKRGRPLGLQKVTRRTNIVKN